MRAAFALLTVFIVGVVAFCFWPRRLETYRDKYVVAGEIKRPIFGFFAHISEPQYLTVNGKTYKGVRGLPPYYLDVPQIDSVLFVTKSNEGNNTFHIINVKTKAEIHIQSGEETFGGNIAGNRQKDELYSDFIEKAEPNQIIAATTYPNAKKLFYLDLALKKLSKTVLEERDQSGQITNRSVYVNGERVQ